MVRFERILCPTDFSAFSFRAADYAVALARHYGGELYFLHVVPYAIHPSQYPYVARPVTLDPEVKHRALDRMEQLPAPWMPLEEET